MDVNDEVAARAGIGAHGTQDLLKTREKLAAGARTFITFLGKSLLGLNLLHDERGLMTRGGGGDS